MMMQKETSCVACSCGDEHDDGSDKTKILIILGIALTIPIVILESLPQHSIPDYVSMILATPIQFLLGWSFYRNFVLKIKQKTPFTTDTLVVLSTSVAYVYSVVAIFTASHAPFFEAMVPSMYS